MKRILLCLTALAMRSIVIAHNSADCEKRHFGLGKPINAVNHIVRFLGTAFHRKDMKILYFASLLVKGVNYRVLVELPKTGYIAAEVYVDIPQSKTTARILRALITERRSEALEFFDIDESDLVKTNVCNANLLRQIRGFDLRAEVQNAQNQMYEKGETPEKLEFYDPYAPLTPANARAKAFAENRDNEKPTPILIDESWKRALDERQSLSDE